MYCSVAAIIIVTGSLKCNSCPLPLPPSTPTPPSFPSPPAPSNILFGSLKSWEERSSDKQLDPFAYGLPADRTRLKCGTAVDAGGVSTLENQLDVVVDTDGAGYSFLHLTVARLQLLQQVVLLRVLDARAAVHLCLVWGEGNGRDLRSRTQRGSEI